VNPPAAVRERGAAALRDAIAVQLKLDDDLTLAFREGDGPHPEVAIDGLDRILAVKPDWAAAHSKLGALHARAGRLDRAIPHLEAVSTYDPDDATGLALLGWLAYLGDRPDEAAAYYQRAERIEPFDAKINYHWGLALLKLRTWADAEGRFRKALEVDPNHAGALQGLAHALRQQGRPADAVRPAWRAAKLTAFREPDVLVTLADAYADAGRAPEAAAAATKALEVADAGPSRLAFDVRQRLEQLRARR
jgi:tetratricopeptide (TPR) repeat protein